MCRVRPKRRRHPRRLPQLCVFLYPFVGWIEHWTSERRPRAQPKRTRFPSARIHRRQHAWAACPPEMPPGHRSPRRKRCGLLPGGGGFQAKTAKTRIATAMINHWPSSWLNPNHWNPGGRSLMDAPSLSQLRLAPKMNTVPRVTTIDGSPKPATSAPLTAPSEAPAKSVPIATSGIGNPDLANSPASTAQTDHCKPTDISIWRARITNVMPTTATRTGALLTRVSSTWLPRKNLSLARKNLGASSPHHQE